MIIEFSNIEISEDLDKSAFSGLIGMEVRLEWTEE